MTHILNRRKLYKHMRFAPIYLFLHKIATNILIENKYCRSKNIPIYLCISAIIGSFVKSMKCLLHSYRKKNSMENVNFVCSDCLEVT